MLKIAVLDAKTLGNETDLSIFGKFGKLKIYGLTNQDEIVERIRDVDIVITNKCILKENLVFAKDLKLICVTATGTNIIDLEIAKAQNTAVCNVAGYSTMSVAQHTLGMLLYLYDQLRYFDDYVRAGEYCNSTTFSHFGRRFSELAGKTWGIIGLGAIGKKVASIAEAFGCKIVYYSTSGNNNSPHYRRVDKMELFKNSDIISIHAPLNDATKNLVTYEELCLMKKEAIILNLGRGSIINEEDLTRALNEDKIAAAALDVLEHEPMREDSPLLKVDNKDKILITPHIAWASREAIDRLIDEIVLNIEAFLDGKSRNRVC